MNTNREQFIKLLELLESDPEIANGVSKKIKEDQIEFWKRVKMELNSLGPPAKDVTAWKKVWSDWKRAVKAKLRKEVADYTSTGGGPRKSVPLTDLEESVARLASLRLTISGVDGGRSFGGRALDSTEPSTSTRNIVINEEADAESENENAVTNVVSEDAHVPRKRKRVSAVDLLRSQIISQKKFYEDMRKSQREQNKRLAGMEQYSHRIAKALEESIAEKRRHNREVEKLKLKKFELEKQLLEAQLEQYN